MLQYSHHTALALLGAAALSFVGTAPAWAQSTSSTPSGSALPMTMTISPTHGVVGKTVFHLSGQISGVPGVTVPAGTQILLNVGVSPGSGNVLYTNAQGQFAGTFVIDRAGPLTVTATPYTLHSSYVLYDWEMGSMASASITLKASYPYQGVIGHGMLGQTSATAGVPVSLSGYVTDQYNNPLPGVVLPLISSDWSHPVPIETNSQGQFSVPVIFNRVGLQPLELSDYLGISTGVDVHAAPPGPPKVSLVTPDRISAGNMPITLMAGATNITQPRYQFWWEDPAGQWHQTPYTAHATETFTPTHAGAYLGLVDVLSAGQVAQGDWSAARQAGPVSAYVSSAVQLSAASASAPGQPVTFTASATDIQPAVYQFWVRTPSGQWVSSGAYASSPTWTWTPPTAGAYTAFVYAKTPEAIATAQGALASALVSGTITS